MGNRLFARGRAYDPDRYPNPDALGEETEAEPSVPELPDEQPETVQSDAAVQPDESLTDEAVQTEAKESDDPEQSE